MFETDDDLRELQALIDRSHAAMGAHMRSILTPERTLTARQVAAYLQGVKHVALATASADGAPFVAPLDGLFIRGRFHVGSAGASLRMRHLRRDPRVSLTHFAGDELAVTVHGRAVLIRRAGAAATGLEQIYVDVYGSSPFGWAEDVVLVRVEPDRMYAYAPHPERY